MSPRPPFWLAEPSRYAALSQPRARIAAALLALLLLATLLALASPGPPPVSHTPASRADDQRDVMLYETIVQGIRGGGDYYSVTAQALRTGDYPMRPFVTFRLPTLAVVQAALPRLATMALLYALVAGVGYAWYLRLGGVFNRPAPRLIALALLASGLMAFVQSDLVAFHEIWGGLLIALSLAVRREDKWIEAVAIGLIAMLIRETAALYVGVMVLFALAEGRRREAIGWAATLGVLAIVVALHAHAVAMVVRETDPASPGWAGLLGFGFFVKTMQISTALDLAPLWIAAPLVGLALFGWSAWRSPLALRALGVFIAYALLLALFGRVDTFYWGLMIAPTLLIGLAFAPDGLRDLIAAAREPRRKIIVTRVTR
ncbi:hypothetical protein [Sphingomonas sp. 10B4]|uniref:hypothetical protein n=1 Tax=Sphingomonas sp. 10B4 TaxID=3048575 RepID=UPI002AB56781|nr:hypothetical protein [Sphingomonas sp. 10B4]MDY7524654.1 hypothetical protein [Sphingomonas sp. 10B4]MEB0284542.1 hypothetical protein [Sphingomonas sp. 10B4]